MITRSPIYNVARSLTSSQYEFIEREFGYSKTSFLDLPDETLVDIYYDLCDIEATALPWNACVLRLPLLLILRQRRRESWQMCMVISVSAVVTRMRTDS